MLITAKRKRYGGHWIMRGDEVIGEAWRYKRGPGFGMSIGGHFTKLPPVYWRNEAPADWGFVAISGARLQDVVAIAQKYFSQQTGDTKCHSTNG